MIKLTLNKYNIELSSEQIDLLQKYMEAVVEANKSFNLTAITDEQEFITKHIVDSLLILDQVEWNFKTVADIGTGAGIPGVILAIVKPETEFTLIDSTAKKIDFINNFCEANGIKNVKAIVGRSEELEMKFDMVTSRAVASLPILLEITSHLVNIGGKLIFYKGRNLQDEMCHRISGEIRQLGLTFESMKEYELDSENMRSIVAYDKTAETLQDYPRLYKEIKSKNFCGF